MSDVFITQIATEIEAYSAGNSLGYTVKAQNSPARKEYDSLPLVLVCPSSKQKVWYPSFCGPAVESSYDVFLVNAGDLTSSYTDFADQFQKMMVSLFMPQSAGMLALGSYQTRVSGRYDYDRGVFPQGSIVSCAEVIVSWIV